MFSADIRSNIPVANSHAAKRVNYPVISPNPTRLSQHIDSLKRIEESGIYTNYGPTNARLEDTLISSLFGSGYCVTVCNATIGIMLCIREVLGDDPQPARRYALMPSFTFAAAAQAAIWNGLTPLLCDIDPDTWLPCPRAEERLLECFAGQIAVIVPYATFGNNLDLDRYQKISELHNIPIVVDAAASLGSLDERGCAFGKDFQWPLIYSMHATKSFAVGEGGVIYCAKEERIDRLRAMGNFGFERAAHVTSMGLNSKMPEVTALSALIHLEGYSEIVERRQSLSNRYRELLSGLGSQRKVGVRQAFAFESILLPRSLATHRDDIRAELLDQGVGTGIYFSPHLAEQPYFQKSTVAGALPVTVDISKRVITLPISDTMSTSDVDTVSTALINCCREKGWALDEQL